MPLRLYNMKAHAVAGVVCWLLWLFTSPLSVWDETWAYALLLFAAFILVPLALDLAKGVTTDPRDIMLWRLAETLQLPAAIALSISFRLPQGTMALLLALPWVALTLVLALCGLLRLKRHFFRPLGDACIAVGLAYFAIGGAWLAFDRVGHRPLEFDPAIVLLTAVHFHYAGFLLPILTGLAARRLSDPASTLACFLVVVAVPLVALGITASQLQGGPVVELFAALVMSLGGVLVAWLHLQLALRKGTPGLVRICWLLCALSLLAGMGLSVLYGLRSLNAIPGLDIPWMRALHGTANALGFGLFGVLGWTLLASSEKVDGAITMGSKSDLPPH